MQAGRSAVHCAVTCNYTVHGLLQLGDEPASMAEAEQRRRQACRDGDERTAARAGACHPHCCMA